MSGGAGTAVLDDMWYWRGGGRMLVWPRRWMNENRLRASYT